MKVLITAGGTTEKIDSVRGISNFATGRLGKLIAERFLADGHEVIYLAGRQALLPEKLDVIRISDTVDLLAKMKQFVPEVDVVVHSMAVSDYRPVYMTDLDNFRPDAPLDIPQNQAKKISSAAEHQVILLEKTPKVIAHIKDWNPNVLLFGFKLLAGVSETELLEVAQQSLLKNHADYLLANDLEHISGDQHLAFLLNKTSKTRLSTKQEIAQAILDKAKEQHG